MRTFLCDVPCNCAEEMLRRMVAQSWTQLAGSAKAFVAAEPTNGPTSSQSTLRLFGHPESAVRVTLFRDNHAWCPYCQKTWLWLEEKQIPYRIEKVTMFCYGEKERWYKRIVPSGMLPALKLDGQIITESDVILAALEGAFGSLGAPFTAITEQRRLERRLFGAWCEWLCYPSSSSAEEAMGKEGFEQTVAVFERELGRHADSPWLLGGDAPSTADVVFVSYVERMAASLYYYKGYTLRDPQVRPNLCAWFDALEARETYRGTQSDFHTHVHDLPPQMGGCYASGTPAQRRAAKQVDEGPWLHLPDTGLAEPASAAAEAIHRVVAHKDAVIAANPCASAAVVDEGLRCALTLLASGEAVAPPAGADAALRYIKDRVNVPRDMSLWAARRLRAALEETAALAGDARGPPIPVDHRRDQDPSRFRPAAAAR